MRIRFIAILVVISCNTFAQYGDGFTTCVSEPWVWHNDSYDGNFNALKLLDNDYLIVASDYGIIAYSDNLGANYPDGEPSWQQSYVPFGVTETVEEFCFFDANTSIGFAISDHFLLKTSDKGQSWNIDTSHGDIGIIEYVTISQSEGHIYLLYKIDGVFALTVTTDDSDWENVNTLPDNDFIRGMVYPYFWTESTIYKEDVIVNFVNPPSIITDLQPIGNDCLIISNDAFYWHSGTQLENIGAIAKEYDETTAIEAGFDPTDAKIAVRQLSDDEFEAFVYNEHLYNFRFRNDNTIEYQQLSPPGGFIYPELSDQRNTIIDFTFNNEQSCFTTSKTIWSGPDGFILPIVHNSESNMNWARCIYFADTRLGYVMQSDNLQEDSTITYKTEDGGISWSVFAKLSYGLEGVDKFFVLPDESKNMILTADGRFYMQDIATENEIPTLINLNVNDFFFIDHKMGWFINRDRKLFITRNSGNSWELSYDFAADLSAHEFGYQIQMNSVSFANSDAGMIGGEFGFVFATEDGGMTWQLIAQSGPDINTIKHVNENIVFIGADNGALYRCLDGGGYIDSWKPIPVIGTIGEDNDEVFAVTNDIVSFHFWDDHRGYVVTNEGIAINVDPEIGNSNFILQPAPMNLPTGAEQKTPSITATNGYFGSFIYARDNKIFVTDGLLTPDDYPAIYLDNKNRIIEFTDPVAPGNYSDFYIEYSIQVENIEGDLIVQAPSDFVISKSPEDEFSWTSTLTYSISEFSNGSIFVYVAFHPETTSYTGDYRKSEKIRHLSDKAIPINLNAIGFISDCGGRETPPIEHCMHFGINEMNPNTNFSIIQTEIGLITVLSPETEEPLFASIIDLNGRTISRVELQQPRQNININHLRKGMYILSIEGKNKTGNALRFFK